MIRISAFGAFFVLGMSVWITVHDYGQCDRACRVHYGAGWNDLRYYGRRSVVCPSVNASCDCYDVETSRKVGEATRLFPKEEAGYPYIERGNAGVCGEDLQFYESADIAARANVKVANCGSCGVCSTRRNVETYHKMSDTLTKQATKCGISYLFFGEKVAKMCMRVLTTLSEDCMDCWVLNMGCTTAHCFKECILRWYVDSYFFRGYNVNKICKEGHSRSTLTQTLS